MHVLSICAIWDLPWCMFIITTAAFCGCTVNMIQYENAHCASVFQYQRETHMDLLSVVLATFGENILLYFLSPSPINVLFKNYDKSTAA